MQLQAMLCERDSSHLDSLETRLWGKNLSTSGQSSLTPKLTQPMINDPLK